MKCSSSMLMAHLLVRGEQFHQKVAPLYSTPTDAVSTPITMHAPALAHPVHAPGAIVLPTKVVNRYAQGIDHPIQAVHFAVAQAVVSIVRSRCSRRPE